MSADRLPELFARASELAGAERERFLVELRSESPALEAELRELLDAPESAPSPIDASPLPGTGGAGLPDRIGAFRPLREIGRGGMGRVYLAEQETPDFRRTVALKLIDDPGREAEAVRRFRDEVRILAALDHPGVVRFLDGGRTEEGVWFLALEYVEGVDLLSYARSEALGVEGRARLALAVAEAAGYAHERGVVHRDLKPANILVGRDGRPRLLDFGISKLLSPDDGRAAATTRAELRALTPAYASPEQLAGEPASPASDVYSIGVVLYELLTGARPERGRPTGALEPPSRGAESALPSTTRRFARRLDAIVLRALAPRPESRQASAVELADDLRRLLDGRASARPRHEKRIRALRRVGALAVVVASVAAILLLVRDRVRGSSPAAADRAAIDAGRFPFDPVNPPPVEESEARLDRRPGDFVAGAAWVARLARDRRSTEARMALARLRQLPGAGDEPLLDYAEALVASGERQEQRALHLYDRALEGALRGGRSELVGTIRSALGALLANLGSAERARAELETACDELARVGDDRPLYRCLNDLAIEALKAGDTARGEAALESAIAAARRAGFEPLVAMSNLAESRFVRGRPDLAEPMTREILERRRAAPRRSPVREGDILTQLSWIVRDLGRDEEADATLAEALALLRAAGDPPGLALALHARGAADLDAGRLAAVEEIAAELDRHAEASLRRRPLGLAHGLRGRLATRRGDFSAAERELVEAHRLLVADGDVDLAQLVALDRVESRLAQGDFAGASAILAEATAGGLGRSSTTGGFLAAALRLHLALATGDRAAARVAMAELEASAIDTTSVTRRRALLEARAAIARDDRPQGADLDQAPVDSLSKPSRKSSP